MFLPWASSLCNTHHILERERPTKARLLGRVHAAGARKQRAVRSACWGLFPGLTHETPRSPAARLAPVAQRPDGKAWVTDGERPLSGGVPAAESPANAPGLRCGGRATGSCVATGHGTRQHTPSPPRPQPGCPGAGVERHSPPSLSGSNARRAGGVGKWTLRTWGALLWRQGGLSVPTQTPSRRPPAMSGCPPLRPTEGAQGRHRGCPCHRGTDGVLRGGGCSVRPSHQEGRAGGLRTQGSCTLPPPGVHEALGVHPPGLRGVELAPRPPLLSRPGPRSARPAPGSLMVSRGAWAAPPISWRLTEAGPGETWLPQRRCESHLGPERGPWVGAAPGVTGTSGTWACGAEGWGQVRAGTAQGGDRSGWGQVRAGTGQGSPHQQERGEAGLAGRLHLVTRQRCHHDNPTSSRAGPRAERTYDLIMHHIMC